VLTIILAGGYGTRLAEETRTVPKPMVEVGGRPLLWHIMKLYARHGGREFAVALGYKGEVIKRYFLDYRMVRGDCAVDLSSGEVTRSGTLDEDWLVHLVDTGQDTQTGGRLRRLRDLVDGKTFMLTYGDGVSDVDIAALQAFHAAQGKLATLTAVRPPARYGSLVLEDGRVSRFSEKDPASESWVNGGFFVMEPEVLDMIEGDATELEKGLLTTLSEQGQLGAYRHDGFWQSMDTLRDKMLLNRLWDGGAPPWRTWE